MKILIAVDGSPHSLAAVTALVDRISWFRDAPALTLLYAHPPIPYKAAAVANVGREAVEAYYEEESVAALSGAQKLLGARGIAFVSEKCVGDPADEIIRHTSAQNFDLIVMGTHGHTALANLVMGSVATRVLARSRVPVLFMKS
jgi:nucleotide-binding universal stress UspA family protein